MAFKSAYIGPVEIKPEGDSGNPQLALPGGSSGVTVVFATTEAGPNTITVSGAAPFLGVSAGQLVNISGAVNAANNGSKTIVSATTAGDIATVSETLVNEASSAPSAVSITVLP